MQSSKASKKTIAEETGTPVNELNTASDSTAKPRGSRSSKLKKETSETGSARHRKPAAAESAVIDPVGVMTPAQDVELGARSGEISPSHEEIAQLAHSYWVRRDYAHGSPEEDWVRAERELKSARKFPAN